MKTRAKIRNHDGQRATRPAAASASANLQPLPEVRVLSGASIGQLLAEVKRATREGFERDGEAYYDGAQEQSFRQAMVRYAPETVRRGNVSVRKRRG